jgi:hypothetical protein
MLEFLPILNSRKCCADAHLDFSCCLAEHALRMGVPRTPISEDVVTYHPGQNPDPEPRSVIDRGGVSFKILAGIALAAAIVFGIVIYSANRANQTAFPTATPSETRGQTPNLSPKGQ